MGLIWHQDSGVYCPLDGEHLVGRSPRAALHLDRSYVSAQHATLRWRGDGWELKDLGSRNGTFLGDTPLKTGEAVRIERGARMSFGHAEETWQLLDDSLPQAAVLADSTAAEPLLGDDILAVPSTEEPLVTILRGSDGNWALERADSSVALVTGQQFEAGGRHWRFFCPTSVNQTSTSDWPSLKDFSSVEIVLRVSQDEEYVELAALAGQKRIDLGTREHNSLLLLLARRRLADAAQGLRQPVCGWLYQDEVLDGLRVSAERLNLDVFRIRKQFVGALGHDGANVIERRPKTKQLRIGSAHLQIERI